MPSMIDIDRGPGECIWVLSGDVLDQIPIVPNPIDLAIPVPRAVPEQNVNLHTLFDKTSIAKEPLTPE